MAWRLRSDVWPASTDRPEWRENIHSPLDAASYYACIENGLSFGTLAGDSGVGTHGGSEDHAAIVTGKAGRLSAFSFVPVRHITDVELPDEWRFVITPSGVAADKTGRAKGPYNRLAEGAAVLLRLWNAAGAALQFACGGARIVAGCGRSVA